MRTVRKKVKSFIVRTTYKLPNKSVKHVYYVASAPQQLLRRYCTRTMCLIQCINFFVNEIILRSLYGRRATHFRLADCRSSGTFLTFEMFYNYEKVRMSSPHSSVETRMPWLDCVVSAQLRINRVLIPQLNRERTDQPSVTEVCVELFYCELRYLCSRTLSSCFDSYASCKNDSYTPMHCSSNKQQLHAWLLNLSYHFGRLALQSIQGGPKKGSHYRESSLNRIKNRQPG